MLFKTCVILGLAAIASTQKCAGSIDGGTSCSTYVSPANAEVNIAGTRNLYKRDASAKKKYMQAFPYGFWELATSGEENLCGIRALVYSLQHQMPGLEHIFDEHEMQNLAYTGMTGKLFKEATGDVATSFYTADFLAGLLNEFGRTKNNKNLQLGVKLHEHDPGSDQNYMLLPVSGPVDGIVWISHQDNHYEGLAPATAEDYRKHKEEC